LSLQYKFTYIFLYIRPGTGWWWCLLHSRQVTSRIIGSARYCRRCMFTINSILPFDWLWL